MTETTAVPGAATGSPADPAEDQVPLNQAQMTQESAAGVEQLSMRRTAVIMNESTIEIPVHLLFRDDDLPERGERYEQDGRGAGDEGGEREPGDVPATGVPRRAAQGATASRAAGKPWAPRTEVRGEAPARPAPPVDPHLSERDGPALPGSVALLGGAVALALIVVLLWRSGAVPEPLTALLPGDPVPYEGMGPATGAVLFLLAALVLLALGGLGRGRVGQAQVLSLFGAYRGSVRRTGLMWTSPLLLRRPVDVRLRHWRSEPMPVVDADGTALRAVVLVVWQVEDTARATYAVQDHEAYLCELVEAATVQVLSQLPADAFHQDAPTLRDAEAVGDALTGMLRAETAAVGIEVFSARPTRIDYAPEVAGAMRLRRIEAIDARHRDGVLTAVVDAVDDTVTRLTTRGLVDLDAYERNALVKDLTVAFYAGRGGAS
ncbi:SPFH domain-containing protein [Streptomyces sp. NBC_01014]|uniref:SPFH domain-containing protein n=1 Tax=Streptomyces sp. NBC_01014 TaxID=2903719 RepID=UPI003865A7E3|nr:SPFH domain-containing protein [Streptomyces sp. NBC_01014]